MDFFNRYKRYFILGGCFILLGVFVYLYMANNDDLVSEQENETLIADITTTTENVVQNKIFVDVKGAVNKPGVYEFNEGDKVIDAIKKAEGLTKSAVTSNINLSKKLTNEMVIYVFNKKEIVSITTTNKIACNCETIEVNNCIDKNNTSDNSGNNKININTATLDELLTLKGIGQSKAEAIIKYREENGNFNSIEDIQKVSGLGGTIYSKIKDYITV